MAAEERIWRCSCGGPHFLSIHSGPNEQDGTLYVDGVYEGTLRQRIREAIRHVLGRGHGDAWIEVHLDRDAVREIRDHLNSLAPQGQLVISSNNVSTAAATVMRVWT